MDLLTDIFAGPEGQSTTLILLFIIVLFIVNLTSHRQSKKSAATLQARIKDLEMRMHDMENRAKEGPAAPVDVKIPTPPGATTEATPPPEPQSQAQPEEEKAVAAPAPAPMEPPPAPFEAGQPSPPEPSPDTAAQSPPEAVDLGPDPKRPQTNLARCGGCGHKLAYKTLMSGKRVKCPSCQTPLTLP